jgi:phage-related protein
MGMNSSRKQLVWVGSSRRDLREFPPACVTFGVALFAVQLGEAPPTQNRLEALAAPAC